MCGINPSWCATLYILVAIQYIILSTICAYHFCTVLLLIRVVRLYLHLRKQLRSHCHSGIHIIFLRENTVYIVERNELHLHCEGPVSWVSSCPLRSLHLVVMYSFSLHSCAMILSSSFISILYMKMSLSALSLIIIILVCASTLMKKRFYTPK